MPVYLGFKNQTFSVKMKSSPSLEDLPNIGGTLARLLREAGIETPHDLYQVGAIQAFIRIDALNGDACFSKLCALEGAVEDNRWRGLSKEQKQELKHFFEMRNKDTDRPGRQ